MSDRSLKIDEVLIQVPGPITHVLDCEGILLILFDARSLSKEKRGTNVWAFSSAGKFLWEIQPLPLIEENFKEWWISISKDEKGRIAVMNCDDNIVHVDPKTGDLYRTDGVKIPRVRTMDEWKNPP
ncbi:MAG: hypothetical protein AB7F86_12215 [Bdellovibrionales bacterium]